jgi:hypothetical protein
MKKLWLAFMILWGVQLVAQQSPKNSVLDLENNNDYSTFSVFDSLVTNNYRLFFTGEDHRYLKANSQLELKMFKYLHKTAGVRVFMMEFGHSMGYITNKYVQTGDTVLEQIIKNHTFDEYFGLFAGLRAFYDSLPENEKFSVVGVDLEREPVYPTKLLETLLPPDTKTPHDSIIIHIEALKGLSQFFDEESKKKRNNTDLYSYNSWGEYEDKKDDTAYRKWLIDATLTMALIIENYKTHKEIYADYLGNNFALFEKEIKCLDDYFVYLEYGNKGYSYSAQQYLYRENYMAANVTKLFGDEGVKAYGQFGRCHTQRRFEKEECNYYYFNSLATRLNTKPNSPLYNKVFSCPVFYPLASDFMDANVPMNQGLRKIINNTKKNTVTAYLLNPNDTATDNLSTRFNALIINNNEKDENSLATTPTSTFKWDDTWDEKIVLIAEAGFSGYNFTNLNNTLKTGFKGLPQFVGFSLNYDENWGFNISNSYHWFPAVEQKISDSLSVTLSGFRAKMRFGTDVIKSNKYDLNIMLGYGFERWKLESRENFDEKNRKDIFGNNRTTTYQNPAFIMDFGLDFRAHLEWITIGAFAGYQYDFSNKHWRVNNNIISTSPKQAFSGVTVGASLGFNISTY